MTRTAYAQAGVDVDAGERAVALIRSRAAKMSGEFASIAAVPPGMREPLVVSATDGVGTKLEVARRLGRFDTVGQDLVAMCADDVACHGARPAYFLDYLAVGRLVPERVAEIVGGISGACEQIGCDLLGGETAEHPGVMEPDEFDLAGFCVGFVERSDLVDGSAARAGDIVIGMASSGLHSNGFSLIRRLIDDGRLPLTDELLTPTRLYARAVLDLADASVGLRGLAHITGGGLARNVPRALGGSLGVRVDPAAWSQPAIFDVVARAAGMDGADMRATFNCGIGFAAIVAPDGAGAVTGFLAARGIESWPIGDVRPVDDLGGRRYVEA
ncbi:MAG TPA: phosphoribosylformylglycinamidine cyclo-ligase [Candidatus Limnocylindria bacterium]|nr:phosphoribosylformylglycinamidine cyclo-ligase [Candidatus Limnocylindria bacterium]